MREILTVQIGGCGIRVGKNIWDQLRKEHGLDENGIFIGMTDNEIAGINTFFTETPHRYVPRCFFIDLQIIASNHVLESNLGHLFHPESFLLDPLPIGNTFGPAYHGNNGKALSLDYMEKMRKIVEICDCFQGFKMTHGLCGGTGSGMSSLVLEESKSEMPNAQIWTYSVFPDKRHSDIVIQPYNSVLGIHRLIENSDATIYFDNVSIGKLWDTFYETRVQASYEDINNIIAKIFSGAASSLKNHSNSNFGLKKLTNNLIPFPRLHFLLSTHIPVEGAAKGEWNGRWSFEALNQYLFDFGIGSVWLFDYPVEKGTFMTMAQLYRGTIDHNQLDTLMSKVEKGEKHRFVDWIPNHIFTSVTPDNLSDHITMASLANSTAMSFAFNHLSERFKKMFDYGGFLHKYEAEGVTREEFEEAHSNIIDVSEEYALYHKKLTTAEAEKYVSIRSTSIGHFRYQN